MMRTWHYILIIVSIVVAANFTLDATFETRKNDNWIAPYLSAAANLQPGGQFNVDSREVLAFKELSPAQQYNYQFQRSESLSHYNHNPIGFAYIIWLATHIFPFTGDTYALLYLQLLVHILLCLLLLKLIRNRSFRIIFFLLYAINPLVINIVVLNYYYFWQCIPGFILIYLITAQQFNRTILVLLTAGLILATLARPTIILLSALVLLMYFKYTSTRFALLSLFMAIAAFILINKPTEKNIWHTIYVGIAAYPNDQVQVLSDDTGYALYKAKTGEDLNASFGGNYYDTSTIAAYKEISQDEVIQLIRANPDMFLRNAILNTLQCFSIGYINLGNYWLNILSAFIGAIILILFITSKQYLLTTGIFLSVCIFSPYYPPIQAYMFGAYVLLAYGFFRILAYYFPHKIQYTRPTSDQSNPYKPTLLYICSNDGSDMRINKELRSLTNKYEVTFVGVGTSNSESYARHHCKYFYLVVGKRNRVLTMLKQINLVLRLKPGKYDSIHIINEQLMIFFYPFLFGKHVVLDIFDSIFLMWNRSKERWSLLKRIVYAPVDVILVTDANRKELMPAFTHDRIRILENFPYRYAEPVKKPKHTEGITILYSGWLGKHRGTDVIIDLLKADPQLYVIMAGWFADDASRNLIDHPQVDYRGVMTQEESLHIASDEADYILCVYAPNNENNINASPNKIYDAIQTSTPVIINKEIKIADFVAQYNLGVIIDNYYQFDANALIDTLKRLKDSFEFSDALKRNYTWENIEHVLLESHNA